MRADAPDPHGRWTSVPRCASGGVTVAARAVSRYIGQHPDAIGCVLRVVVAAQMTNTPGDRIDDHSDDDAELAQLPGCGLPGLAAVRLYGSDHFKWAARHVHVPTRRHPCSAGRKHELSVRPSGACGEGSASTIAGMSADGTRTSVSAGQRWLTTYRPTGSTRLAHSAAERMADLLWVSTEERLVWAGRS